MAVIHQAVLPDTNDTFLIIFAVPSNAVYWSDEIVSFILIFAILGDTDCNVPINTGTIVIWASHILVTSIQTVMYFLSLLISLTKLLWSLETAMPKRIHFLDGHDWLGDLKDASCLEVRIQHDLDLVVLSWFFWLVSVAIFVDFKSVFPTETAMKMSGHFIMVPLVFSLPAFHKR